MRICSNSYPYRIIYRFVCERAYIGDKQQTANAKSMQTI